MIPDLERKLRSMLPTGIVGHVSNLFCWMDASGKWCEPAPSMVAIRLRRDELVVDAIVSESDFDLESAQFSERILKPALAALERAS